MVEEIAEQVRERVARGGAPNPSRVSFKPVWSVRQTGSLSM